MLVSGDVIALGEPPPRRRGAARKTGIRRSRSTFQIALWIVIGTLVIGGGVVRRASRSARCG